MQAVRISVKKEFVRGVIAPIAALALALTGSLAAASPASAASNYIATPNGMVGVQQTLVVHAPKLVNQVVTVSGTQGTIGTTLQTVIGGSGYGSVFWTPTAAGTWVFSGAGNIAGATSATITVAAVPTETTLAIPNQMQVNTGTNLQVVVNTRLGDVSPAGQVTVRTNSGAVVGSAYLSSGSGAQASFATIPYLPTATGVVPMVATFTPANGNFAASTSAQAAVDVVTTAPALALKLPGKFNVGETVWVTAFTTPSQPGTVAMQVENEGAISGSIPLVNGSATVAWTPTTAGNTNVRASFTNAQANTSGVALQPIAVLGPLPADTISVAPTGQSAWIPNTAVTMTQGQNLLLTTSSASGSPVVLDENGPCVINSALLTAVGTGTCTLTAVSGGSADYTEGTATYTVKVVKPAKKKKKKKR